MGNLSGFKPEEHENTYDALPKGEYLVVISKSEMKRTKNDDGSYLHTEMDVIDGPRKGAKVFHNMTMDNRSEKAVTIGKAQLATICKAVGVLAPSDSSELHNKPFVVLVDVEEYDGRDQNRVTSIKSRKPDTSAIQNQPRAESKAKPPTAATAQYGVDGDDIPF